MNIASKPSSFNCWIVIDLPTITFLWNFTPIFFKLVISLSKTVRGNLKGGIPYLKTPPSSCKASKTTTSCPAFLRSHAAVIPAQPDPTMATFLPDGFISGISAFVLSPTYLSIAPIATGSPFIPSTQFPSHCLSWGQTLPQTEGSILVWRIISPAFCKLSFFNASINFGIWILTGHPWTHLGFLQCKHLEASIFACSSVKLLSTGSKFERLKILSCSFTLCLSINIPSSELYQKFQ